MIITIIIISTLEWKKDNDNKSNNNAIERILPLKDSVLAFLQSTHRAVNSLQHAGALGSVNYTVQEEGNTHSAIIT